MSRINISILALCAFALQSSAKANIEVVNLQWVDGGSALLRWKFNGMRWSLSDRKKFPGLVSSAFSSDPSLSHSYDQVPLVAAWRNYVAFTCRERLIDGVLLVGDGGKSHFIPHAGSITGIRFSSDGKYLFLLSGDYPKTEPGTTECISVSTCRAVATLPCDFAIYTGSSIVYQDAAGTAVSYRLGEHLRIQGAKEVPGLQALFTEYGSPRMHKHRGWSPDRVGTAHDAFDPGGSLLLISGFDDTSIKGYIGPPTERDVVIAPEKGVVATLTRQADEKSYAGFFRPNYLVFWRGTRFQVERARVENCEPGIYGLALPSGKLTQIAPLIFSTNRMSVHSSYNQATTVVEGLMNSN